MIFVLRGTISRRRGLLFTCDPLSCMQCVKVAALEQNREPLRVLGDTGIPATLPLLLMGVFASAPTGADYFSVEPTFLGCTSFFEGRCVFLRVFYKHLTGHAARSGLEGSGLLLPN